MKKGKDDVIPAVDDDDSMFVEISGVTGDF